jgi:tetratricopeptide (TPR) repeat protein
MFSISNILAEKLLTQKPNYKPILLILWKWYYELWDLENAKKYLENYYKLEPKDNSIAYILWVINFKLRDYIASNLYYNAALENWFEPKIELERKLAYNYYLLWDKRLMLNMFSYLINEENSTIDDYSLWIYNTILEWRTLNAISRSEKWLKKFFWNDWYEIFYAYLWWISRENWDFEKSREYLEAWLKINPKNPLITLNMWYLEEFEERYNLALVYFKRTININWDWEFWELAKKEVLEIEKYLEKIKDKSSSWTITKQ